MAAIYRDVILKNSRGLHARPAALIVKTAKQFKSLIMLSRGNDRVNGKSIMGVLMLAAPSGTEIRVEADGEDAQKVLTVLGNLIETEMEY